MCPFPSQSGIPSPWNYKWPTFIFWRKEGMDVWTAQIIELAFRGWREQIGHQSLDFSEDPLIREPRSHFIGAPSVFCVLNITDIISLQGETRSKRERWTQTREALSTKRVGSASGWLALAPLQATEQTPSLWSTHMGTERRKHLQAIRKQVFPPKFPALQVQRKPLH